jgi:exo-1,4-beta-D-glucosaminidase
MKATLRRAGNGRATVHIQNTGAALAFQVHLELVDAASGDEYLPVYWDDNYFELLPGEARDIAVEYPDAASGAPALTFDAWNVASTRVASGGH